MKAIYLDCFAGFQGNMLIGALLDAGVPLDYLAAVLSKLPISRHTLSAQQVQRCGIRSTLFSIQFERHEPVKRRLADVFAVIECGQLSPGVTKTARGVFARLAEAEAIVHGATADKVFLHEVGSDESIAGVVGALIGCEYLKIERIRCSALHAGSGFVDCAHGRLPIPAPATAEILKQIPFYSTDTQGELVTPTGAALVVAMAESFGPLDSRLCIEQIAYGAGAAEYFTANILRVYLGTEKKRSVVDEECRVKLIETNMDDMNPQHCGYVLDLLMQIGALDAFYTPIYMKKNRPGIQLTVAVTQEKLDLVVDLIFRETSTIGVKILSCECRHLDWEMITTDTQWGTVRIKIVKQGDKVRNIAPEYEDCRRIAKQHGVPLKDVYQHVMKRLLI